MSETRYPNEKVERLIEAAECLWSNVAIAWPHLKNLKPMTDLEAALSSLNKEGAGS